MGLNCSDLPHFHWRPSASPSLPVYTLLCILGKVVSETSHCLQSTVHSEEASKL